MRNLDLITMAQTIGRVIRLDKSDADKLQTGELKPQSEGFKKPFGKMFVPVYSNVGISTEKRLQELLTQFSQRRGTSLYHKCKTLDSKRNQLLWTMKTN